MATKAFEIKGIERDVSPIAAPTGSCEDMVNLRPKDGGLRPILPKKIVDVADLGEEFHSMYSHDSLPDNNYLIVVQYEWGKDVHVLELRQVDLSDVGEYGPEYKQTLRMWDDDPDGFFTINALGDVLVLSTEQGTTYHLYRDGEYKINASMDTIPELDIHISSYDKQDQQVVPKDSYEEVITDMYKQMHEQGEEKRYSGHVFLMATYRLIDGTTIRRGSPAHMNIYTFEQNGTIWPIGVQYSGQQHHEISPTEDSIYKMGVDQSVRRLQFAKVKYFLETTIPEDWASIIRSIEVYAAYAPLFRETPRAPEKHHVSSMVFPFDWLDIDGEFKNLVFRKIDSHTVDADEGSDVSIDISEEEIDLTDLHVKDAMPVDSMSHHELMFKRGLTYNGMLHMGDVDTRLYDGHNLIMGQLGKDVPFLLELRRRMKRNVAPVYTMTALPSDLNDVSDFGQMVFRVYIETPSKEIVVQHVLSTDQSVLKHGDTEHYVLFKSIITYPHPNAKRFEVIAVDPNGVGNVVYSGELTTHPFYNMSYHVYDKWEIKYFRLDNNSPGGDVDTSTHQTEVFSKPNRIQLTAVDNPFVWPARNSYLVGPDRANAIVDMAVQSTPTSEGQFGQYPLVVFGDTGIYLMNHGQGDVEYGSSIQVSRLRAKRGAMGIDGIIIFTTDHGLYLLQGRETRELNRKLFGNIQYGTQPTGHPENPITDGVPAETFLQGAMFGYDDLHKEIIIANDSYAYHYKYAHQTDVMMSAVGGYSNFFIRKGMYYSWQDFAIAGVFDYTFDITFGYAQGFSVIDLSQDETAVDSIKVYYKTNPQTFEVPGFKKVKRLITYMDVTIPVEGYLYSHLFGGNIEGDEGEYGDQEFMIMQHNGSSGNAHVVHMILGRTPASHRFFTIMLSGRVDKDSVIQHMEADIHPVFARRIR